LLHVCGPVYFCVCCFGRREGVVCVRERSVLCVGNCFLVLASTNRWQRRPSGLVSRTWYYRYDKVGQSNLSDK
jgi:hypothetical protein